jgi:VWFA-related protein
MKMRGKLRICAALMLMAAAGVVRAQVAAKPDAAAPASSMQVDANLVIVPVAVRDKKGELIKGLTKDNFSLQVKGTEQPIRYFDNDSNQPLTVGLLVDVGRNMQGALDEEKKASQAFLDAMLAQKGDKAFVLHFAHDIELLQDVTDDRARLEKAVRELGTESATFKTTTDEGMKDSEERQIHGHGTSLYDAVYLASDEILQAQKGRKALVLITDGVDAGSKEVLTDAIEAAQRANIALYAIYIKGAQPPPQQQNGNPQQRRSSYPGSYPGGYPGGYPGSYPGGSRPPNPNDPNSPACQSSPNDPNCSSRPNTGQPRKSYVDGKQLLERMCGETGGRVFEVSKKLSVEQIYAQISDELRTQYLIGFTPDATAAKSGYHQIDLRMTGAYKDEQHEHKVDVQARDGYYMAER